MNYNGEYIDDLARVVLAYLYNNGREATTGDVTKQTKIDDNDIARYRFKQLSEAGLVETEVVQGRAHKTTRVELTDEAVTQIEKGTFGDLCEVHIEHDEAEAQRVANQRRSKQNEENIEKLAARIAALEEYLEEEHVDIDWGQVDDLQQEKLKAY